MNTNVEILNAMCGLHFHEQRMRLLAEQLAYATQYKQERAGLKDLETRLDHFTTRLGKAMKNCETSLVKKKEARAKCDKHKDSVSAEMRYDFALTEVERLTYECEVMNLNRSKSLVARCKERDAMIEELNHAKYELEQCDSRTIYERAFRADTHYIAQRNNMESLVHECEDLKTQISDTSFTINRMRSEMIKTKNPCYKRR